MFQFFATHSPTRIAAAPAVSAFFLAAASAFGGQVAGTTAAVAPLQQPAALAQATTEDDYRAVMDKYSGTPAAGNAALLLAGAGKYSLDALLGDARRR